MYPPPDKNLDAIIKMAGPSNPNLDDSTRMAGPHVVDKPKEQLSSKCTKDQNKCRFLSLLRNMRVEFQTIRNSFSDLIDLNSSSEKETCSVETSEIHTKIYVACSDIVNKNIGTICDILEKDPCISEHSDTVQAIKDKWYLINSIFENYTNDNKKNVDILKKCVQYLEDEIYLCNIITVPDRVKDHLDTLKAGYALDFYEEFKDEFCSKEQETDLIKYLARHPAFIDDIIDASQGLIFKVDPKNKRWQSYVRIIGTFLLGVGAIVGSLWILGQPNQGQSQNILRLYLVFVCGALFHIFIGAIKETKSSTGLKFKSVEDWFLWANIKELSIITGILLLDFTFIGLYITIHPEDVPTLAAAGYSFDSIGDVFIGRFETILSKKGEALKDKISIK